MINRRGRRVRRGIAEEFFVLSWVLTSVFVVKLLAMNLERRGDLHLKHEGKHEDTS